MNDIHQFVPNYHRLSQAEADWAKAHPEDQGGHAYVEKFNQLDSLVGKTGIR